MSVTYYKNKHFNGVFGKIGPGFYYGQGLAGCGNMSSQCEDLSRNISSLRIDENVIVALGDSVTARAGVRVLMGPMEVSDVSTIKMEGKVVSAYVAEYVKNSETLFTSGRQVGATIFNNSRPAFLSRGDYNSNRLASEEVKIPSDKITSIGVMDNTIVVLSASETFRPDALAVMLVGPLEADLDNSSFSKIYGNIRAIRVLSGRQPLPVTVQQNIYPVVQVPVFQPPVFQPPVFQKISSGNVDRSADRSIDRSVDRSASISANTPPLTSNVLSTQVLSENGAQLNLNLALIIIILLLTGRCMATPKNMKPKK